MLAEAVGSLHVRDSIDLSFPDLQKGPLIYATSCQMELSRLLEDIEAALLQRCNSSECKIWQSWNGIDSEMQRLAQAQRMGRTCRHIRI